MQKKTTSANYTIALMVIDAAVNFVCKNNRWHAEREFMKVKLSDIFCLTTTQRIYFCGMSADIDMSLGVWHLDLCC